MVLCMVLYFAVVMEVANLLIFALIKIRRGVVRIASPLPIFKTEPKGTPFFLQNSRTFFTATSFCSGSIKPQFIRTDMTGLWEGAFSSSVFRKRKRGEGMLST